MKKILVVFGTRPEAIKMAPLIDKLKQENYFNVKICITAQHRQMLDEVLNVFDLQADYDLDIMKPGQNLFDITSKVLLGINEVLTDFKPDIVLIHGDTTTTSATALAAFYHRTKIGHVEAGLRTYDIYSPWPEEANRQIAGVLSTYHFAPTELTRDNLISEKKNLNQIIVTGNTVIDALFLMLDKIKTDSKLIENIYNDLNLDSFKPDNDRKIVLVTGHRRENFGSGFINICEALKELALKNPNIDIVYPVHLNPNVQKPVKDILNGISNVYLINPLKYESFVYMMSISYMIITDSGGVQEEAPSLGKPVLVMRDTTERIEALNAGTVKLVGTDKNIIIKEAQNLLDNIDEYNKMAKAINPYGDGKASNRIVKFLKEVL